MTRLRPRSVRTAAAGLVAAAALTLTGCSATNPITTTWDYAASDGAGASVGEVRVLNMVVVSAEEGAPGVLTGALANGSSDDEDVTLTVGDAEPVSVQVGARQTVLLGVSDAPPRYTTQDVPVAAVDTRPGGLTQLKVTTSTGGTVEFAVPVLDAAQPQYAALLESISGGSTATATPTDDATRDASEPQQQEQEQGE
ncbi:hypothetical protein [Cellulomonas dongxiuzhuiae]|uniref:hypothetical protein n=1 Tax=Cellulomonas dongxiuzhuiae TaxID=2819979 RepID=UPI001AAEBF1A|nr:hypothetical protein [Cellulomonas dongxiuzhuiae]MBO3088709.1 hypothetical protein [Cellulomonas dongxiuzhuiae]